MISIDFDSVAETATRIALIAGLAFAVILVLQRSLNPLIRIAIREQMEGEPEIEVQKRTATLSRVVYRTLLFVVIAVAVIMILPEFGINAAALIAGLGLLGLAVGFGAQSLVKDVITGLFILAENQYGVGDVITAAGIIGTVEDINLRRTVLRDLDGTVHFIPHSQIDVTSNWTKSYSNINLDVRVSYAADLPRAIEVLNRIGLDLAEDPEHKDKIISPPHVLRVDNLGESWIDIKLFGETAPIEQWGLMGELRLRIKQAFDEEGLEFPFPQRTLHMDTRSGPAANGTSARPRRGRTATREVSASGQPGDPRLPSEDDGAGDSGEGGGEP